MQHQTHGHQYQSKDSLKAKPASKAGSNFKNDPEKAAEAGRKGGKAAHSSR